MDFLNLPSLHAEKDSGEARASSFKTCRVIGGTLFACTESIRDLRMRYCDLTLFLYQALFTPFPRDCVLLATLLTSIPSWRVPSFPPILPCHISLDPRVYDILGVSVLDSSPVFVDSFPV